ncbi:hypothetical protein R1flu_019018 [Riccia fluitans]|uniref:Uncharacterized protein n=1 Tax=Riccia fluitans TaxID=41844 RepID=A0ABD1ZHU2_9MARC
MERSSRISALRLGGFGSIIGGPPPLTKVRISLPMRKSKTITDAGNKADTGEMALAGFGDGPSVQKEGSVGGDNEILVARKEG